MSTPEGREPVGLRDLLAAAALDAVDDVERHAVERLVAHDDDAARELAGFRAIAAALGTMRSAQPPAALRASVLDQLSTTPQDGRTAAEVAAASGGRSSTRAGRRSGTSGPLARRALQLAAAAAVVAAVAVPSVVAWQEHGRAVEAQAQAELLGDVLADRGAQVLRADLPAGGKAVAVLTEERALLVAEGLEDLDADHVYQLWAMRDGVPVPSTLVQGEADGRLQALAEGYQPGDGVALTVEPAGGSQAPTTDPLLVLLPG